MDAATPRFGRRWRVRGPVLWLALFALLSSVPVGVAAAAPQSLLVVDANTGATLIGQSADEPRAPASLTKMMTLYLTFEALERGSVTMKTPIRISARAANVAPSKLELDVGDTIPLEDAILALITKSANDIAVAIAEHLSGSEEAFATAMTQKARQIGMTATTFRNASGLPDSAQTTTARDMVTLGLRLYDAFPRHFGLFSTRTFSYGGRTYKNHNTLMLHMAGVNGIKTGYTHASGFNLVTSYASEGRHLMAAIFGGETAASRNSAMRVALIRAAGRAARTKTRPNLVAAEAKAARAKPPVPQSAARRQAQPPIPSKAERPAPPPAPVLVAEAAAAPEVPPPSPPAPPPARAASPVIGPNVQMAKVRTVDVAPLAAQPSSNPAASPSREASSARPLQPAGGPGVPSLASTLAPASPAPVPVPVPVPADASAAPPPPPPAAAAGITPGRPPSSLDQQHAALERAAVSQPSYRLSGPAETVPAPRGPTAGGGYEIQLGAFTTAEEADRLLSSVQSKSAGLLAGHAPVRRTVTVGGKTLQRARFTGFNQAGAAAACAELARQQHSCIVMRAE